MKQNLLKTMFLLFALVAGMSSAWATDDEEWSYTFNQDSGISTGSNTLNEVSWNIGHDSSYENNESSGYHVGSSSKSISYLQLSTSGISGTISKIVVNAKGNGTSGTISASVNSDSYTETNDNTAITNSFQDFEFTGSSEGEIIIRFEYPSSQKKNFYVASITVTYTSGSGDPIPSTFTVTYDKNGNDVTGSVPEDDNDYEENDEVTVLGNTGNLAKEHYTFGGWNTQDDGEGTNYSANATFNITANTTLYAKWVVNTNSVTLPVTDTYGEYTMNKSNPVAYGAEVTLTYTPASGYENYVATWSVNGTPISGNKFNMPDEAVTITVSLKEVYKMTLANSDIVAAGNATTGYSAKTITDDNGKTWNAYAIKNQHSNATSSYHFLQIRAYDSNNSTAYYIQIPDYGRKITSLKMTVSGSSQAMNGGSNSATLFFSASNSTSATGTGVASGTGNSTVTIDCSSLNLNTGYITTSAAVRIWDVEVTYEPLKFNSYGFATYASTNKLDLSDDSDFSAWMITSVSGDVITFSQVKGKVDAKRGVLLMGTPGAEATIKNTNTSSLDLSGNKLVSITTPTEVSAGQYYGLSGNEFVPVNAGIVPAGRALLPVSALETKARSYTFVFSDASGIDTVREMPMNNGAIYNLAGQRMNSLQKGVNIVNGKKVFVK